MLEIQKKNVLLLTRDGRFVKYVKKQGNYAIGQELAFTEEELLPNKKRVFTFPFLKPISMVACSFLLVFLFFYNGQQEKVMAYVSVDINPSVEASVEASVDSKLRVLRLEAYNEEGKQVIKKLKNWRKQPLPDVIGQIINRCRTDGYLTTETQITLTSVVTDPGKTFQQQLKTALQTEKTKYTKERLSVVEQEGTIQIRENAKKSGMSIGTYMKKEKAAQPSPIVPEAPIPIPEQSPANNQVKQAPSSPNAKQEEKIEKKQVPPSPSIKQEEKIEKKQAPPPPSAKQEEKIEKKQVPPSPSIKQEEKIEKKQVPPSPSIKQEEKIEKKQAPPPPSAKQGEKIEKKQVPPSPSNKHEEEKEKKEI